MHLKAQVPSEQYLEQVLAKNIQNMIFIFKRRVSSRLKHFLAWFKQELVVNDRFREVYLEVVEGPEFNRG